MKPRGVLLSETGYDVTAGPKERAKRARAEKERLAHHAAQRAEYGEDPNAPARAAKERAAAKRAARRAKRKAESTVVEADVRLRELERKAAQGDSHAAIALGRELERAGRPTYEYWSGLLRRNPRSIPLRVMWLNAAQREDEPAYVYSTTQEEIWFEYAYYYQTSRNDGIEEEEIGPFDSEHEADQAGRAWWVEMQRDNKGDEYEYDYEVIDRTPEEPEREHDELVDDEEATLEELLRELSERGMWGEGDDGRWYSEDREMDYRTGRERQYYIHVRYLIPYAPHDMLTADSKRIADALKRNITDAERVPMLDPDKVRR